MKTNSVIFYLLLALCSMTSCFATAEVKTDAQPISHQLWGELLSKHVSEGGKVDYKGFQKDRAKLDEYLHLLSANHPNPDTWTKNERLAYWINAYNAFTIQIVLDNYPLKSIKDVTSLNIAFVHSVWDIKFIKIEGEEYDLNNIEHGILRKKFEEPRIHFAIVCASVSCPNLRNEAYTADKLEEQLQQQAVAFINDPSKNQISASSVKISKIFTWFKGDFTKNGSLADFLNKYSKVKIEPKARIDYLDYNWDLNE
ncbi:DUF547 domain-containing protein [Limibacter armeniacum]|uniref:DUF547 domain-containing protein n=1 Tax=Limibacter armeniacum TaxID=466084 RepID=UPI002FE54F5E